MTEYDCYSPSIQDLDEKGDVDPINFCNRIAKKRRGRDYRRAVKSHKQKRLNQIITTYNYKRHPGYLDPDKNYIKHFSHSRAQKFLKHYSNKIARRVSFPIKGCGYRRCLEYEWWIY